MRIPEDVVLDIVGIPNKGETWEQLIGRFRRTGIDPSKLQIKVWHLDADPIPDHKSMMNVAEKLDKQTIFSKGGLSVPWISTLLGRCHVWSSLSNYISEVKKRFFDELHNLGLSEFQGINNLLLNLEFHENQELARQLVKGIEDFLCERENIIDIEEINEVEICTDVNVLDRQEDRHIVFRELKRVVRREDGVAGSEELYFGIKTYKKELDQFMKSVIIPFYGFEEMWIRFENSVMPFLLVNKVDKENVLRLFEQKSCVDN